MNPIFRHFDNGPGSLLARGLMACVAGVYLLNAGCEQREIVAVRQVGPDEGRPVVRGPATGLELRWWVVGDLDGLLGRILHEYANGALPVDDRIQDAWARSGIRAVSVPTDAIDDIRDRMPLIGAVQREWLGTPPQWMSLARGARLSEGGVFCINGGDVALETGRFVMDVRGWPIPASMGSEPEGLRSRLHLELRFGFEPPASQSDLGAWDSLVADVGHPGGSGITFRSLSATMTLDEGMSLVLVPEDPGVTWEEDSPEAILEAVETIAPVGPPVPRSPTLGEALLMRPTQITQDRKSKVVLVLVPWTSSTYEIGVALP